MPHDALSLYATAAGPSPNALSQHKTAHVAAKSFSLYLRAARIMMIWPSAVKSDSRSARDLAVEGFGGSVVFL